MRGGRQEEGDLGEGRLLVETIDVVKGRAVVVGLLFLKKGHWMGEGTTTDRLRILQESGPELGHEIGGDDVTGILGDEVHDEDAIGAKVLLGEATEVALAWKGIG